MIATIVIALTKTFAGAALREVCRAGIRLADKLDPAGIVVVKPAPKPVACPDYVPEALLMSR